MAKYIVDLPDAYTSKSALLGDILSIPITLEGGKRYGIPTGIKLEPFTNPDRKAIEDEVWENTWKMFLTPEDFGATMGDSYSEAKAKYDAWKKEKEEIHIGDEVQYSLAGYEYTFIVFGKENDTLYGIRSDCENGLDDLNDIYDGWETCYKSDNTLRKTGRHFDEVEKLLERMREE